MKTNKQFTAPVIKRKEDPVQKSGIQKKIKIGRSDDKSEREADNAADRVMRMPANEEEEMVNMQPQGEEEKVSQISKQPVTEEEDTSALSMQPENEDEISMQPANEEEPSLQKKENDEETVNRQVEESEEEKPVQTKEESSIAEATEEKDEEISQKNALPETTSERYAPSKVVNQINVKRSGGQPLPEKTNRELSGKMGKDFSNVKIHTDSRAVKMNEDLKSKAFTHKNHIYFNQGQFTPENSAGKKLLAHELAHVVQQKSSMVQRQPEKIPSINVEGKKRLNDLDDIKYYSHAGLSNVRIKKTSPATIKIIFVNNLDGKPEIVLPHLSGFKIEYMVFSEDSFHVSLSEMGEDPKEQDRMGTGVPIPTNNLDKKIIFFNVDNNGGLDEKRFTDFSEVLSQIPSETKRAHTTGLRTEMSPDKVSYSMEGGKLTIIYNRNEKQLSICKADNLNQVLFNSKTAGYTEIVDVKININGEGNIVLKKDNNEYKNLQIDLKKDFNPDTTVLDNQEFVKHDTLVKKLKEEFKVKIQEEARIIPVSALSMVYNLINNLSDTAKQLLISAAEKEDLTLEYTIARDFSESKLALGNKPLIGGQINIGDTDFAFTHEFIHFLYNALELNTEAITEDDLKKPEYTELSGQVEKVKENKQLKTKKQAINELSTNTDLNQIWLEMFKPLDPGNIEGFDRPENARIIDLCDEGNYNLTSYVNAGHPFDNLTEFVASFITIVNFKQDVFTKVVKASKSAEKGIAQYYRKAWDIIVSKGINLGTNPF